MIKSYTNIDPNKKHPLKGMIVKELCSGREATITGVYESDDEVWMVSGNDIGVFKLSCFWEFFKEVQS